MDTLKGGMTAESVIKIGSTVHRTKSSNFKFIHTVLIELEQEGFRYSPRFLGVDQEGREKLSFIDGDVPRDFDLSLQQKIDAIKILRQLHDTLSTSKHKGTHETICHNDFAPWNIIVNNHDVIGIIDFDDLAPGNRIDDVAYMIWTFLELGTSDASDDLQIKSILDLVNAYELQDRSLLVNAFINQQSGILDFRNQLIEQSNDGDMIEFSKKAVVNIQKSIAWVNNNRNKLEVALLQ